jgi:uncharacterized oxidoreductase
MKMQSNTIFITGATSGIGQGLAEAFHKLGNQVIISGRREERLKSVCAANSGMRYLVLDVRDPNSISSVAAEAIAAFPALNCVISNSGVQHNYNFGTDAPFDDLGMIEEIDTNLAGVVRVAAAFLPHLKKAHDAVLANVSSGLAFVPLARFPIYCATKAAVHSFTMSLRQQLRGSGVKVIEIIPPYVATELGGPRKEAQLAGSAVPQPMPLDAFIAETMKELATGADEVVIENARNLMGAASPELVRKAFAGMNR